MLPERAKKQKEKRKCPPPEYAYNFLPAIVNQHQHTKHSQPVPPAGVPQDASFEEKATLPKLKAPTAEIKNQNIRIRVPTAKHDRRGFE